MKVYVTTLLTKEIFDQLSGDTEHVLMQSDGTEKQPYALVDKAWLERRIGSAEILFPRVLVKSPKTADERPTTIVSKNQIDLEDMIKDVEEKGK
jgi:hypothetical protein